MNKIKEWIKGNVKLTLTILSLLLVLSIIFNGLLFITIGVCVEEEEQMQIEIDNKQYEIDELENKNNSLESENEGLQAKVDEAKPWFEMKEEERKAEEERLQKEKKEKERKAQEEKEKKEKQGYDTGITYSQLARTPDEYEGEKVKFSGKVLQVSEGLISDILRLAVGGDYDNILYLTVPKNITDERILEDDYITIYGVSTGIETYTTVMGASVSIPSVSVDKVGK